MKWSFIVFCFYLGSLFFREERISGDFIDSLVSDYLPSNIVVHVDSVSVSFSEGLKVRGLRVYDREKTNPIESVASADLIVANFWRRRVTVDGARYPKLPDSYYAPGNLERNSRIDVTLPSIPEFKLVLERAQILGLTPQRVEATVSCTPGRLDAAKVLVEWPGGKQDVKHGILLYSLRLDHIEYQSQGGNGKDQSDLGKSLQHAGRYQRKCQQGDEHCRQEIVKVYFLIKKHLQPFGQLHRLLGKIR